MPRLRLLLVAVCALALAAPAHAWAFARTEVTLPMDDGVPIGATLYLPDGAAPPSGWPAIVMFHRLGATRAQMNTLAESSFANQGYSVLTFDTRGHGESGGLWSPAVIETFGAPVVRVTASGSFDRIVAVLTAARPDGTQLVVSAGGVKVALSRRARVIPIRLISQVTTIPAGSRLTLTLGATSTVAGGNLLYLSGVARGTLTIGAATMSTPALQTPVSRP